LQFTNIAYILKQTIPNGSARALTYGRSNSNYICSQLQNKEKELYYDSFHYFRSFATDLFTQQTLLEQYCGRHIHKYLQWSHEFDR